MQTVDSQTTAPGDARQWYVLRDLTRPIAKVTGYSRVLEAGLEVFTPMRWVITKTGGRKTRRQVPVVHDLLFVRATRDELDPLIDATDTLQYRFVKGGKYREPMTVRAIDMDRFIAAATATDSPEYFTPAELTALSYGRRVRLVCDGVMDGYEARLLQVSGTRRKKILVELAGMLAVAYDVTYIQFI